MGCSLASAIPTSPSPATGQGSGVLSLLLKRCLISRHYVPCKENLTLLSSLILTFAHTIGRFGPLFDQNLEGRLTRSSWHLLCVLGPLFAAVPGRCLTHGLRSFGEDNRYAWALIRKLRSGLGLKQHHCSTCWCLGGGGGRIGPIASPGTNFESIEALWAKALALDLETDPVNLVSCPGSELRLHSWRPSRCASLRLSPNLYFQDKAC